MKVSGTNSEKKKHLISSRRRRWLRSTSPVSSLIHPAYHSLSCHSIPAIVFCSLPSDSLSSVLLTAGWKWSQIHGFRSERPSLLNICNLRWHWRILYTGTEEKKRETPMCFLSVSAGLCSRFCASGARVFVHARRDPDADPPLAPMLGADSAAS